MPLCRYQIRNEYSLGDPDLYKAADKDDPEALLEGVAMAGVVGVLRQLGDLAEFAAEIFHDLHEEVMATAARGHGLIVRVQQLEAEFPSVERTLLSQTSHTAFLYNSGVDWRPNLRVDPNLVTQGDLPRFVMDLYEECRGPPRLFLLDKFDVAGAGACLKRFTDPSFFKAESASTVGRKSEGQREKKTRRVKKRGPRWRNGDTPETLTSSHAKLHQLFLEERIESGGNNPERRVKLKKRQYTGCMFDQDKEKSYMEKFLDTCLPEQKIVHEICIDALPLPWTSDTGCKSGLEIVEIGTASALQESILTDKSVCSSPDTMGMVVKPSINDFSIDNSNEIIASDTVEVTRLNHERCAGRVSSVPTGMKCEEFADDGKSAVDVDQNSDEVTSEIDYYMDALATIESEIETDSECKKNSLYLNLKPIVVHSDTSEGKRENQSFDAQSVGSSITSEDSNKFFKERESSSCSVSVDSFAETIPDLVVAAVAVPSVTASNLDHDKVSVHFMPEEISASKLEEHASMSHVPAKADDGFSTMQDFGDASNLSRLTGQNTISTPEDMEANLRQNCLPAPDINEVYSSTADPDFTSVISDQGHANLTASWSYNEIAADAPERTDSGHWLHVDHPLHNMADTCDVSFNSFLKESENIVSVASSGEEDGDHLGEADVDVWSDIGPPVTNQPISDSTCPETIVHSDLASKATDLVSCEDFCIPSIQENSKNQPSAIDFASFNIQESSSESMNPDHSPRPHSAAEALPSSQESPSIKETIASVQYEERDLSAYLIGQTETLPPISDRPQMSGLLSSSVIVDAAEADIAGFVSPRNELNSELLFGSSDGATRGNSPMMVKQSSVLEPSETQHHWQKHLEKSDTALSEHYPVCSADDSKAAFHVPAFASDAVCEDVVPIYLEAMDPVATVNNLDDSKSVIQAYGTSELDQNDVSDGKKEAVSCDTFLFGIPCELASNCNYVPVSENILDLRHDTAEVEHIETGTDASTQIDTDNYQNGNVVPLASSLSVYADKVQECLPISGEGHQNEEKLSVSHAANLAAQNYVDSVRNAHESMTSDGSLNFASHNVLLADNDQNHVNSDVVNALLTSENNSQDSQSISPKQIHLLEVNEDDEESLGHNISEPMIAPVERLNLLDGGSEVKPLHADKLSSQSFNSAKQIQTSQYVDRGESVSTTDSYCHGLPSVSQLPAQSAESILEHTAQPIVKSTSTFSSNDIFNGDSLASQEVESFPVSGMLLAEPQVNLDPPPLPPLPPVQWRLIGFKNSFAVPQQQMVQHTIGPVLPVPAADSQINSQNNISGFKRGEGLSFSIQTSIMSLNETQISEHDFVPQHEVPTLPMLQNTSAMPERLLLQHTFDPVQPIPATVSEVSSQNKINGNRREYNLSFTTPTSIVSDDRTQLSADGYAAQQGAFMLPIFTSVSEVTSQDKMNGITIPPVSANSQIGNQLSEGSCQLSENPCEPGSSEGSFCGHSLAAVEVKVNAAVDGHNERLEHIPQSNGVRTECNLSLNTHSTSSSQIGNQYLEDSCQPCVDPREHGSFKGRLSSGRGHTVVEVKTDTEFDGQHKFRECITQVTEQEAVNSLVQLHSPSIMQLPPGFVAPEVGTSWLSNYDGTLTNTDGNANGSLQKKPPRPRNPLIVEAVAVDKSKLRKVERVKPPVEPKLEDGGSFLEQMQLRKVERVKPAVETKSKGEESPLAHLQLKKVGERVRAPVEESEFSLEQLHLRKVGERVKAQVELKAEERESLLKQVQLRKVGKKVKPDVEQKLEDTESLRVQLRNVGVRVKPEVDHKPEQTESPRVQLRKVGELVKPEVEQAPEETESPQVQLRKVSERVKSEVELKPEDTESPRDIGGRVHPLVELKTDDRDSLLEQIRNKSFNLKPGIVARPKIQGTNVQGPRANLKVAAILEKASNIRQAMAGSDEEDDTDNWSDY